MKTAGYSDIAWIFLLAFAATFTLETDAQAYLDPGTGSYVMQLFIAGIVGSAFAVKTFWRNIKSFAGRLIGRKKSDDDSAR